jgi:hypothetical protein
LIRVARVVPVIAGAALIGGMIGGFAIFAIDSALTWQPSPQSRSDARPDARSDARAENATPVLNPQQQQNKPVRIVGGAIPDPSAGMSGPPPVQKPQRNADPAQPAAQISSALFTAKPLGPASELQRQTAATTATTASSTAQPQGQSANQLPVPAPNATPTGASAQPQTRWPDALSRAHQNAGNAQQQTAPAAAPAAGAQTADHAANNNSAIDRRDANSDRAVSAADYQDFQDRPGGWRHGRHSRRHAWRYGGDDDASGAGSRRQQARSYDRLYDSYGNRRDRSHDRSNDRSYGNTRQRSYGDTQPSEAAGPRPEPFWGGGSFRRGYRDED